MRRVIDMNGKTKEVLRGGEEKCEMVLDEVVAPSDCCIPSNLNDDCSKFGSWLEQSLVLRLD